MEELFDGSHVLDLPLPPSPLPVTDPSEGQVGSRKRKLDNDQVKKERETTSIPISKKQRQLDRNRDCAAKHRQKVKDTIRELTEKCQMLERDCVYKDGQILELEKKVDSLNEAIGKINQVTNKLEIIASTLSRESSLYLFP